MHGAAGSDGVEVEGGVGLGEGTRERGFVLCVFLLGVCVASAWGMEMVRSGGGGREDDGHDGSNGHCDEDSGRGGDGGDDGGGHNYDCGV